MIWEVLIICLSQPIMYKHVRELLQICQTCYVLVLWGIFDKREVVLRFKESSLNANEKELIEMHFKFNGFNIC